MNKRIIHILSAAIIVLLAASCSNYENWSTDPAVRLSFDCDTVRFDTIITTVPSCTKRLMVFNPNNKGLRIQRAGLVHGTASHYRVNVDGEYLTDGAGGGFELIAGDSLFVLVEVTLPDLDADGITRYTDSLYFQTESGQIQYVSLEADGQNALHWHGEIVISKDSVIASQRPIVIYDTLTVNKGATLTIQAGTTLMFDHDAFMQVEGQLIVNGTYDQPVVFRGSRTGGLFDYLPYDNTPQQWGGVILKGEGNHHTINCLDMHSSSWGLLAQDTRLTISNSTFHNSGANALTTKRCNLQCYNTQISNSYGDLYSQIGGSTDMVFCTLAQYYNYDSQRGNALYIADNEQTFGDVLYWPLKRAHFYNCVITGYGTDVITGNFMMTDQPEQDPAATQDKTDYLFHNCYLRTVNSDEDSIRFVRNIYEEDTMQIRSEKQWVRFQTRERIYDFTPLKKSAMSQKADTIVYKLFPSMKLTTDRRGTPRPTAPGAADIGAFHNDSIQNENNPSRRW